MRAQGGRGGDAERHDPNLGPMLLDLLERGIPARAAIDAIVKDRPHIDYRQLTAVDRNGHSASWSGKHILGTHGVSEQQDCVAAGNLLKHATLPRVMTDAFAAHADQHLAERLLRALEAGLASGGEEDLCIPQPSSSRMSRPSRW